jgi:CRISPR-associated protein Csm1
MRRDGRGYDTAAHLAALSRELDLFFSGWMQHQLSQVEKFQPFYTVFSGGDDLFLVGPWDRAAALAREIYERFRAFVGGNPQITLSAGVLFAKDRYPIARAAGDAEGALERSKERAWEEAEGEREPAREDDPAGKAQGRRTRDQLTVLGDTFRWQDAPAIFAEIDRLRPRLDSMKAAFLYSLVEYGRLYRLLVDKGNQEGLRYKPLFAYNIARNLRKGDRALYDWADGLLQSLHGEHGSFARGSLTLRHLELIATTLLFYKRVEEHQGEKDHG